MRIYASVPNTLNSGHPYTLSFGGWLCAITGTTGYPQFSVVKQSHQNDSAMERFLAMAASSDYHDRQIRTLLDTFGIPLSSTAVCPVAKARCFVVMNIRTFATHDLGICQHGYTQLVLDYDLFPQGSAPPVSTSTWSLANLIPNLA